MQEVVNLKVVFFAKLYGLNLGWVASRGSQLTPLLRITNDDSLARDLRKPILLQMGSLEAEEFTPRATYVYAEHDTNEPVNTLQTVNNYMAIIQIFLTLTWLIKDNNANTETGFAYSVGGTISSNTRAVHFTKADGSVEEVTLTKEEFSSLSGFFDQFGDGSSKKPMSAFDPFNSNLSEAVPDRNSTRIERAWHELQRARSASYLPAKIASYCTVLEALLSIDGSEISHKISERTARLLGRDISERLEIFRNIKAAYNIRSKNVHGSVPPKDLIETQAISVKLDELIRRLFVKVFKDAELRAKLLSKNEALEEWLLELTLG